MRSFFRILTFAYTFLLLSHFTFAQNWHPALPGKSQFFLQSANVWGDSTIHGFRTTFSHVQGSDSIFEFNRIARWIGLQDTLYDCMGNPMTLSSNLLQFRFDAENAAGDGMIAKPNNEFWFFGPPADTFVLKTQFPTGDKWLFNGLDSAWIQTRTTQTIYGTSDSVIQIQTDNGREFWLSQNHGFVQWDYFYPLLSYYYYNIAYESGKIWAIEETQFGNHFPRFFDIWDLQPNDQFQYSGQICGFPPCATYKKYRRVNTVTPQPTSVTFGIEGTMVQFIPGPPSNDTIYSPLSGGSLTANEFDFFELLPGEYDLYFVMDEVSLNQQWNNRVKIQRTKIEIEDTCANLSMYFERMWDEQFGEGLGRTSYKISDFGQNDWETLICYNKVSEIWNGPCDTLDNPIAIDDRFPGLEGITLFPQPAQDRLLLRSQGGELPKGTIQIFDLSGKLMEQCTVLPQQEMLVDVSSFPEGLYVLHLRNEEGFYQTGKFTVQR